MTDAIVSADSNIQAIDSKGNLQWSLNLAPYFKPVNNDRMIPFSPVVGKDGTIYVATQAMTSGSNPATSQIYFYALAPVQTQ